MRNLVCSTDVFPLKIVDLSHVHTKRQRWPSWNGSDQIWILMLMLMLMLTLGVNDGIETRSNVLFLNVNANVKVSVYVDARCE